MTKKKKAGFTLIELSIVIVIIGLIVAGVLGGQSLVKQAKIKSMINQFQSFKTALTTFKLQYEELPGDITNAYDYWGRDCAQNENDCNGDGDGFINFHGETVAKNEGLRAWQHLYLAKIFDKKYSGFSTAGTFQSELYCDLGVSNPKSPFQNVGFTFMNKSKVKAEFKKTSSFIKVSRTRGGLCNQGFLTPKEMFQIDNKYDDGRPRTGLIQSAQDFTCLAQSDSDAREDFKYKLTSEKITCSIIYDPGI